MDEPTALDPHGMSMAGPATSPLRAFLRTEAASASVLAAAIALALAWARRGGAGYGNLIPNPGCSDRATYPLVRV